MEESSFGEMAESGVRIESLKATCAELLASLKEMIHISDYSRSEFDDIHRRAEHAIAKAEGR